MNYLTADQLSERIHYSPRYINNALRDTVLIEGIHYIRPFGGKKILYLWEAIERDLLNPQSDKEESIPLANGGVCHG